MTKTFSVKEALSFGWTAMKSHVGLFAVLILILLGVGITANLLDRALTSPWLNVPVNLVFAILQMILQIGVIKITLQVVDKQPSRVPDLWSGTPLFLKYLLASLLYFLIFLPCLLLVGGGAALMGPETASGLAKAGGVALLVAGVAAAIYLGLMFSLYPYLIVDKNAGPVEALGRSRRVTSGARGWLFVFGLLLGLINVLGALVVLIGLFVTLPVTLVAMAYVYRQLLAQTER
jgi:hypothetical protein